jgi:hypothetical protein
MSPLTTKAQSLKFESKTPRSTARRPKKTRKAEEGNLEAGKLQKPANGVKSGKAKQNVKKEQEKLKIKTKAQNEHSP